MTTAAKHMQAQVEDYHSSESDTGGGATLPKDNGGPRKQSPAAQANVKTRRSKELKSEKAQEKNMDLRSDSGYSSYTATSKSSADSAPSTSRYPPAAATNTSTTTTAPAAPASPAPRTRKSAGGGGERQHHRNSNDSSPRQRPSRTASVSSKQRPPVGARRTTLTQGSSEECRDPNWLTCGPNADPLRRPRPEMPPSMSHNVRNLNIPSDQVSHRSDPNPYSPPSPTYARQPAPYGAQGPAVIQPARTRRPSTATRPRPQSFAGEPGAPYWVPGMPVPGYPSPPQEQRGPPPSFYNPHLQQHMQYHLPSPMPYMQPMPPQGGYYSPQYQVSPPYEPQPPQRPPLSARGSSQRQAPLITQERDEPSKFPSARYAPAPTAPERQQQPMRLTYRPKPKLLHDSQYQDDDDSHDDSTAEEDDSDDEYEAQEEERRTRADRALMPPPILRRNQSQRPPLSHAKTAPAVEHVERRERRKSIVVPDPLPVREPERERPRRQSVHRPAHRQTRSDYATPQAQMEVNRTGSNRRQSYQAYERAQMEFAKARQAEVVEQQYRDERKREKRASRVIVHERPRSRHSRHVPGQFEDDEDEDDYEEPAPQVLRARSTRRKTVAGEDEYEEPAPQVLRARSTRGKTDAGEERTRKERAPEPKNKRAMDKAEEYIMSTRGSRSPFADQVNKAAKRQSTYDDFIESGSSHSGGASQSNRTTMTSTTGNEVRLRIDNTQPINLQLSGDMDGRTLQLVPGANGTTELVIGSNGNGRDEGTIYHSQRGSVKAINSNRRSMIEAPRRRDVEDYSERSSRTGRSRRDRDEILEDREEAGHALRRTRRTVYN